MPAVLRKPRNAIGEITRDGISLIANLLAPNHLRLFLNRSNILLATIPTTIEMNDPINTGSVSLPSSDLLSIEAAWAMAVVKTSSTTGAPAQSFYKGHTGIGSIPDSLCGPDVLALILQRALSLNHEVVERRVSEDAKLLGVRLDKLRVEVVSKCKDGKPCLQVSGMASASMVSESRVRGIVVVLVSKYTGILRINTDNLKISINTDYLKAPPQSDKDSRIK